MKGPGVRLDLDVRREWNCPQCGKIRRILGDIVNVRCSCTREGVHMQLIETRRQTRSFADVIERVQQASAAKEQSRQNKSESAAEPKSEPPENPAEKPVATPPAGEKPTETQN